MGKEVAETVAERLGYECISRDVLLEASDQFNIPEIKLERAIHDAPSILDRITHGKLSYITYFQSALTSHAKEDNILYHGLAGHVYLKDIPHVLKVRIIANLQVRIDLVRERDKVTETEARNLIARIDEERRKWTKWLLGVDPWDPALYDLVIHIDTITVVGAVDLICEAVSQEPFKTTARAQQLINDLALACRVKSALLELDHNIAVTSEYGNVLVYTKKDDRRAKRLDERARGLAGEIKDIHNIEVRIKDLMSPSDG